jgi:hypothetical protein
VSGQCNAVVGAPSVGGCAGGGSEAKVELVLGLFGWWW